MATVKQRIAGAVEQLRDRHPHVDHAVRAVQHYGETNGSLQAAGVTYAAFLSFFPILALGFAIVGFMAAAAPADAPDFSTTLQKAIGQVFPNLVGDGEGEIPLSTFEKAAPAILSVGLPLALWSGLGWLGSMRTALLVTFRMPEREKPNFVIGKVRDLLGLVTLGLTLMLSVAVSGVVGRLAGRIMRLVDLEEYDWLLASLVPLLGIAANVALFYALFVVLARPDVTRRALLGGAAIGAVGFEVLKQLSSYLIASTAQQPAFQAFGIALVLLVWINYFTRLVLLCAAWAETTPGGSTSPEPEPALVAGPSVGGALPGHRRAAEEPLSTGAAAALGAGAAVAGLAVVRRLVRH